MIPVILRGAPAHVSRCLTHEHTAPIVSGEGHLLLFQLLPRMLNRIRAHRRPQQKRTRVGCSHFSGVFTILFGLFYNLSNSKYDVWRCSNSLYLWHACQDYFFLISCKKKSPPSLSKVQTISAGLTGITGQLE